MSKYQYSSDVVLNELLRLSSNVIWKNPKYATSYESGVDIIQVEQYLLARQGRLTFEMIYSFDEEPLRQLGFSEDRILSCLDDNYAIPEQYRDAATKLQQQYILDHYVEENNYYRMLSGLPDNEDSDYLYNTKYADISVSTVPIHELSTTQLHRLENVGFIDEMIQQNPTKKYLTHLTDRKIDIYAARNAPDYGLLYLPPSDLVGFQTSFRDTYEKCRAMVSSVYRIKNLASENTEYHGFIGLVILFATIIQMHQKFLDADITREFFDDESLRYIYDSYEVPFYSKIPMEYHREIVKNMNRLISMKGSTECIYELFDIFGFSSVDIFEYYMIRIHKFENGKPVFIKKPDGTYDYEKMFDVKFAKCRLYDDPAGEISKLSNHVGYHEMTDNDPYWITDKPLVDLIYNTEYNFVDSKYLGIQTSFEMMRILYEGSFFIKLILDNRKTLSTTSLYYKNIRANCNVFDFIVYVCCIMCRKNGLAGNIAEYPHEIGKFLGFNFKQDLSVVIQNISENDYLKNDRQLIELLKMTNVDSLESVTRVYGSIVKLRLYLTNKMHETHDRNVYFAYYELYNMLMYSEYVEDIFKKSDGTVATTFEDLLEDLNPALYERYNSPELYDENTEISDLLYTMELACNELKLIHFADDLTTNAVFEYIFKLIEFFKSYDVDLTGYEIVLSLAHNSENIMKLLAAIDHITEETSVNTIYDELFDLISFFQTTETLEDNIIHLIDQIPSIEEKEMWQNTILRLEDRLNLVTELIHKVTSSVTFVDEVSRSISMNLPPDSLGIEDQVMLLHDKVMEVMLHTIQDGFRLPDTIVNIVERSNMNIPLSDPNQIIRARKMRAMRSTSVRSSQDAHSITLVAQLAFVLFGVESLGEWSITLTDEIRHPVENIMVSFSEYLKDYLKNIDERILTKDEIAFLEKLRVSMESTFDPSAIALKTDLYAHTNEVANPVYLTFADLLVNAVCSYTVSDKDFIEDEINHIHEISTRSFIVNAELKEDIHVSEKGAEQSSCFSMKDCLILESEIRKEES